jgi:hypothetical protein
MFDASKWRLWRAALGQGALALSAKPLRYRLKLDGSYVLNSVGLDGKDDGGDPGLALSATPGLWGGRDAVWPSPATE